MFLRSTVEEGGVEGLVVRLRNPGMVTSDQSTVECICPLYFGAWFLPPPPPDFSSCTLIGI